MENNIVLIIINNNNPTSQIITLSQSKNGWGVVVKFILSWQLSMQFMYKKIVKIKIAVQKLLRERYCTFLVDTV